MSIVTDQASGEKFSGVIKIEEEKIRSHVDGVVRASVEETLNGLLEAEAAHSPSGSVLLRALVQPPLPLQARQAGSQSPSGSVFEG